MTPGLFSSMVILAWAKRPKSFADEFARGDPGFLGGLHQSIAVFGQFFSCKMHENEENWSENFTV